MESYAMGNAVAAQGRYANIASAPPTKGEVALEPLGQKKTPPERTVTGSAEGALAKTQAKAKEREAAPDGQKAKYQEVVKDVGKLDSITQMLNDLMAEWGAELRFHLHEKSSLMTVKLVDVKNNKVLREFPPEEYLDMIANIRDYIGALIDEKA